MNLFIAVFDSASDLPEALTGGKSDLIRDVMKLDDNVFVIRSPVERPAVLDDVLTCPEPSNCRVAVIFKLNGSYSGYQGNDVWDWLERARVTPGA